jgi:type I restriction enzyme M protein
MASSASDSQQDRKLRETLVKTGHVDALIYVGNNFFYTKSLPCTLWFFDKGKPEEYQDKVLFINAQDYHTAVDTTHNEWSTWQLKNLAAIVWLYRGEAEKYEALVAEYITAINAFVIPDLIRNPLSEAEAKNHEPVIPVVVESDDFSSTRDALQFAYDQHKEQAKGLIAAAGRGEKKQLIAQITEQNQAYDEAIILLNEALWLTERFGDGKYDNIPGFCNVATTTDIEDKAWSLTPGAYVGVPPAEDDGVDFAERMAEIHAELVTLQDESNNLIQQISQNFVELRI